MKTADEFVITGIYFKSKRDSSTEYLVDFVKGYFDGSGFVNIGKMECSEVNRNYKTGDNIQVYLSDVSNLCTIDLVGKYFTINFKNNLQLYYCDKKYYDQDVESNSIKSLMECVEFGIDEGLKHFNINVY